MKSIYLILTAFSLYFTTVSAVENIKFCVINEYEFAKCEALQAVTLTANINITVDFGIFCVLGSSTYDCMKKVDSGDADIVNFDIGTSFYAIQNFGLRAFAVESYNLDNDPLKMNLTYTSNAVVAKGTVKNPGDLNGASACFPGVGSAEGWIYPLSMLIKKGWLRISNCNSDVKNMNQFFSNGSCAPGSTDSIFNVLGDNGQQSCSMCDRKSDNRRFCGSLDPYAGNAGAIECLKNAKSTGKKSVAFVRGDILERMIQRGNLSNTEYELLCPDKTSSGSYLAPLSDYDSCNWGRPASRMLLTKISSKKIAQYKIFFRQLVDAFGVNGTKSSEFQLFRSTGNYTISLKLKILLGKSGDLTPPQSPYDLMFTDTTQNIYFPPESQIRNYFTFASDFIPVINTLQQCPIAGVKWCVIDEASMRKCARMKLALDMRQIQPQFNCVQGGSTTECMKLISEGFADLMTLDAAEVYVAGKFMKLVPIAIEFYGDDTSYYAVAIVQRTNPNILISNWKYKRTCHSGAGKATGWVIPVNVALDTVQIRVYDDKLTHGFGELVSRSCVPGILDKSFNFLGGEPTKNPVNLCELCSADGHYRCAPDTRENYYGDAGAFRCLVENGDIAFARHTTVHDNTDGRNPVYWARSRRSDDYELLCSDGRRVSTDRYKECNLARIPGNMVVTGDFKTREQRDAMWRMLRYAQEYYASDSNNVFQMFSSPFGESDLMFSDSAVLLHPIPFENQTYEKVLNRVFMREIENLEYLGKLRYSGLYTGHSVRTANYLDARLSLVGVLLVALWPLVLS